MKQAFQPSRILMLKSHSAGIGDVLRSSAAWRVLKNTYPKAELHLLLFSRETGYPSEELLRDHHLLDSFAVVDKRTDSWKERRRFWKDVRRSIGHLRADLIIDFEPDGLRTSTVALWCAFRWRARTIGVNSVPGRGLFYGRAAVSPEKYARQRGLALPLEYAERDFVALSVLGLKRENCPIEIGETEAGRAARLAMMQKHGLTESEPLLGLNIGCGTPGAGYKRPDFGLLTELIAGLQRDHGMRLVLTGASFERETNREFIEVHGKKSPSAIIDTAGETSISGLTGIINACSLFISSDSGPYHIAVALGVPTLAVFRGPDRQHFHEHPWVRCCVATRQQELPILRQAAAELLKCQRRSPRTRPFESIPAGGRTSESPMPRALQSGTQQA
jgi:ADP-heptose:LPS heptosyltransferase